MTEERKYPPFDFRIGRLIRDAEEAKAGQRDVTKFTVAVNKSYDRDDDYLVGVTVFNDKLRALCLGLRKGDRVALEGTYRVREYNGKEYHDFVPMSVYRCVLPTAEDDDEL